MGMGMGMGTAAPCGLRGMLPCIAGRMATAAGGAWGLGLR